MSVRSVHTDLDALTMTVTAEFDASVEAVWELWADPRKLEQWWGPPTWPATVTAHDLQPGGEVRYHMTGPDSTIAGGMWRVLEVQAPDHFVIEDAFVDESGAVNEALPVTKMTVMLEAMDNGATRATILSEFASQAALEELLAMGIEEGLRAAMGQIDDLLADPKS